MMSTPTPLLIELARWSASVRLADIPLAVKVAASRCLIDTLGVALAGSASAVAGQARAVAECTAAPGLSSVIGNEQMLNAAGAAFVNGVAGHALDFDDNCYPGFVHGSVVIMPAALAVTQMRDLDGAALLTAFVVGAECEYALSKAMTREIYDRGWWTTGVLGVVGSCAAACHALGLDAAHTASALGIALTGTGGMKAGFGSDAKMLMAGRASEAGVIAALLAREGSSGPTDLVEHSKGLAVMFNGGVLCALPTLGQEWSLLTPGVDIKRIPICLSSHAAVDALREILSLDGVRVDAITEVICDVPPIVIQNLIHDAPTTRQQAQFSMPFAIAATCLLGEISLDSLTDATINRPDLQHLMTRVRMVGSKRWQPSQRESAPEGAWVRVMFADGTCIERFCAMAVGCASNPLSPAQLHEKFMRCATQVMSSFHAGQLLERLEGLEHLPRVRDLLPHLNSVEPSAS
jgi:2-methylcitrate dehydratase PrpD